MIRAASAAMLAASLLITGVSTASAGNMRQSPALRKNQRRMCPNGKPMQIVRTGRTAISGCR